VIERERPRPQRAVTLAHGPTLRVVDPFDRRLRLAARRQHQAEADLGDQLDERDDDERVALGEVRR
jgi:hypothetical protein